MSRPRPLQALRAAAPRRRGRAKTTKEGQLLDSKQPEDAYEAPKVEQIETEDEPAVTAAGLHQAAAPPPLRRPDQAPARQTGMRA